jgi:hypothetical protein
MPKPQLKNIEEHLQFLVGQRNPFTKQDHLRKTSLPAVMSTDTAFFRNPHYHQSNDTIKTMGIEFIRKNAEAVTKTLKALLQKNKKR